MNNTGANIVRFFFIILLISFPVTLFAQQDDDPSIEDGWDDYFTDLYMRGDQTFIISLGTLFPTVFIGNVAASDEDIKKGVINPNFKPPVGGTGLLAYNYYLHPKFFVGGEVSGFFIPTLRGHTLFVVPLGLRAGTQFIFGRFEFPVSISLGMCWHTYLDYGYYGLYMKGTGAAYFRATSDWSFGLSTTWGWFPQWTSEPRQNVDGNFVYTMLTARYHF